MSVSTRDDADRELVDLLAADPGWVRRQFDVIVATEFPPDPPTTPVRTALAAVPPPAPVTGAEATGRAFRPAGRRKVAARRHRQRSPPAAVGPLPAVVRHGG